MPMALWNGAKERAALAARLGQCTGFYNEIAQLVLRAPLLRDYKIGHLIRKSVF